MLGGLGTTLSIFFYPMRSKKARAKIQEKRLRELVEYARKNSRYYAELYKDIGDDWQLEDLPSTTKKTLMEHFADWPTDPEISMESVLEHLSDVKNLDKQYLGKYLVSTTSGSTGIPTTVIQSQMQQWISACQTFLRSFRMKIPVVGVSYNNGFGADNGSARQFQQKKTAVITNKFYSIIESSQKPEVIIRELNKRKPKVILGYTSSMLLLTDDSVKEPITHYPKMILCAGESLMPGPRKRLSEFFHCPVHALYGCTEGSSIAYECDYNHFHINSDWTIMEPIDKDGKRVPDGVRSEGVLMTNLASFPQPYIRYLVTDAIVYHSEGCPCGSKDPWMEVSGRADDVLHFDQNGTVVAIPPIEIYSILEDIPGMRSFQLVLHPENRIELRMTCL
ncbi:MAG: phenylacetate--CoA ligase family protein, partial [Oscillospiraceae bacterium]|nr:phenylacetate--CoA ligase family protein [Oscillospiraceae bacterium]